MSKRKREEQNSFQEKKLLKEDINFIQGIILFDKFILSFEIDYKFYRTNDFKTTERTT
jgi:hypothetical protein